MDAGDAVLPVQRVSCVCRGEGWVLGSGVGWYPGYTRRSRGCGRDHTVTSGWCQVPHFGVLARVLWHGLHPQVVVVRVKHG